jgi:hypothetical protein
VNFKGIQAYHGGLQHVRDPQKHAAAVQAVVDRAAAAVDAISDKAGVNCQVVTGGARIGWRRAAAFSTEVQPGEWLHTREQRSSTIHRNAQLLYRR